MSNTEARDVRFEALKIAGNCVSESDSAYDVLVHAGWLSDFVESGADPCIDQGSAPQDH